jgi:hypothetical protein
LHSFNNTTSRTLSGSMFYSLPKRRRYGISSRLNYRIDQ